MLAVIIVIAVMKMMTMHPLLRKTGKFYDEKNVSSVHSKVAG